MKKIKSLTNKLILLFIVALPSFQNTLFAQNQVELIVAGIADDKEKATLQALRSALEQTYGCFISSNTKVLDDILVNDEIITISQGSIVSYDEVSAVSLQDNKVQVTLKVVTSISDLASYTKSKGITSAEFNGTLLNSNLKLYELNKKNEVKTLKNLYEALTNLPMIFDYNLNIGNPKIVEEESIVHIPINISLSLNENFLLLAETFYKNLISISEFNKKNKKLLDGLGVHYYDYFFEGMGPERLWSSKSPLYLVMLNKYGRGIYIPGFGDHHASLRAIINEYIKRLSLTDNSSYPQETRLYTSSSELFIPAIMHYMPKKDGSVALVSKKDYAVFHLDICINKNDITKFTKFEVIETEEKECIGKNFLAGRVGYNSDSGDAYWKPSYSFENGRKICYDHDGRIIYGKESP